MGISNVSYATTAYVAALISNSLNLKADKKNRKFFGGANGNYGVWYCHCDWLPLSLWIEANEKNKKRIFVSDFLKIAHFFIDTFVFTN